MPNLSAVLSSVISVSDTTITPSPTIITRNLNNPTFASTTVFYNPFMILGVLPVSVTLPAATVFIVYIKNLHATNNILVNWIPNNGVSRDVGIVAPGGVFMYFQTIATPGSSINSLLNGVTALTLQASAATTQCEVLLAA